MNELDEILLNKSHIPNNPFRQDIVDEVEKCIGIAYADDVRLDQYLTIDKYTLAVSHQRLRYGDTRDKDLAYYDMTNLFAPSDTPFTYKPDQLEIDAVVLDFFPIEPLNKFPELAEKAIFDFVAERGVRDDAVISFPDDTFDPSVYIPSESETVEWDEGLDEEFLCVAEVHELPLKKYIRVRPGKVTVNKHKLLIQALNHYYPQD